MNERRPENLAVYQPLAVTDPRPMEHGLKLQHERSAAYPP